jgi:hypothetical protein
MSKARKATSSLSKGVTISYGARRPSSVKRKPVNINVNKTAAELERDRRLFMQQVSGKLPACYIKSHPTFVSGLSFDQRAELLDQDVDMDGGGNDGPWMDIDDAEDTLRTFPPGEEGFLQSHAGQEAIYHQIAHGIKPGSVSFLFS